MEKTSNMKNIFTAILFFFSFHITAQDFTLTVNGGSGSGSYFYGDTIHVFSDNAPVTGVFRDWTGSGASYLDIADEWHTTLLVPQQSNVENLELSASFDQLPAGISQTTEMISLFGEEDGVFMENVLKEVNFSIPENPKGIIFLFHGTDGRGSSMYSKYEIFSLIKDFYKAGYGCIATDANERTLGDQDDDNAIRWLAKQPLSQEPENNVDLFNIQALRDTFVARYDLSDDVLFFSYGVSNGANFSDLAAAALGFQASAHNVGNGSSLLYSQRDDATPVIWLQSKNDNNVSADPAIALANYQALLDRNICTEWHWLEFSPIYENRFMRSRNNIGEQKSVEIYNRFFDYPGLVDGDNFLTISDLLNMPMDFFDPLGLTSAQMSDVISQLKVVNADHTGHGDFNKTIIRFFENICATTAVKPKSEIQSAFSIFPNPAKDFVFIKTENTKLNSVTIFNSQGKFILKKELSNLMEIYRLDLGSLPRGVYFLKMESDENAVTKKVVLQ
jgi:Secretion system C-terminal sorting domain